MMFEVFIGSGSNHLHFRRNQNEFPQQNSLPWPPLCVSPGSFILRASVPGRSAEGPKGDSLDGKAREIRFQKDSTFYKGITSFRASPVLSPAAWLFPHVGQPLSIWHLILGDGDRPQWIFFPKNCG